MNSKFIPPLRCWPVNVAAQQLIVNIWRAPNSVKKTCQEILKKSNDLHLCNFAIILMFESFGMSVSIKPMIKKCGRCFVAGCVAFSLVFLLISQADAATSKKAKTKKTKTKARTHRVVSASPSPGRYADLVIEADTGRILSQTNSTAIRHPASLTKMMTLYLAFQALENGVIRLETPLPVSSKAANQSPSKLGLRAGQTVRAYDAVMGLVTESANDAAVVLAEALAGSTEAFANLMVSQSRSLGMRQTVFKNPNGLPDPEQVTTARDMATLGHALIYHFPGFYPYFSQNSFVYRGRSYNNHNNLMKRYEGMDGIKTGYIRASGFNLVASAVRGRTRLIGVIFGGTSAASRDRLMEALLDKSFEKIASGSQQVEGTLPLPSKVSTAFASRASATPQPPSPRAEEPVSPPPATSAGPAYFGQEMSGPGASSSGEMWGIQVGAYSDVASAQQHMASIAQSMAPLLRHSEQSLQKISMTDGSAMYRARFMGLEQKTARAACSYMVKHGHGCLVVTGP